MRLFYEINDNSRIGIDRRSAKVGQHCLDSLGDLDIDLNVAFFFRRHFVKVVYYKETTKILCYFERNTITLLELYYYTGWRE